MAAMAAKTMRRTRAGPHTSGASTSSTSSVYPAETRCAQTGAWWAYQPTHVGRGAVS